MTTIIRSDLSPAIAFLQDDELVAIPTETVYGLAANACSERAVKKVFETKERPLQNPLIVHSDSIEKIEQYVDEIPPPAKQLFREFAPGPLTVLLPSNGRLPGLINNKQRLMAFRIPSHPVVLSLLQQLPFPLVAPSANRFTGISPTNVWHVWKNFAGKIPYILDGGSCAIGVESTVIGFDQRGVVIYRHGAITEEAIKAVVGNVNVFAHKNAHRSPGLLPHHYSPATPLFLTDAIADIPLLCEPGITGLLCFRSYNYRFPVAHQFMLSVESSLPEASRNFYKVLHYLDDLNLKYLVAEKLPNIGLGITLNDRLQKAAYPSLTKSNHAILTTD